MTDQNQLLRDALEQIENLSGGDSCEYRTIALNALAKAEALSRSAQPEGAGEAVAWIRKTDVTEWTDTEPESDGWAPLCTTPPSVHERVAEELERIAYEAPVSGNLIAQARVLMAAGRIRAELPASQQAAQAVPEDVRKDAERYQFAMDPENDEFAVCRWFEGDWWPIDENARIDDAMLRAAKGEQ